MTGAEKVVPHRPSLVPWVGLLTACLVIAVAAATPAIAASRFRRHCASSIAASAVRRGCPVVKVPRFSTANGLLADISALTPKLQHAIARRLPTTLTLLKAMWAAASKAHPAAAGPSQEVSIPAPPGMAMHGEVTAYTDDATTYDNGARVTGSREEKVGGADVKMGLGINERTRVGKCPSATGTVPGHLDFEVGAKVDASSPRGNGHGVMDIAFTGEATAHVGDDARLKYYDLVLKVNASIDAHGSLAVSGDFGEVPEVATMTYTFTHLDPHDAGFKKEQMQYGGELRGPWTQKDVNLLSTTVGSGIVYAIGRLDDAFLQKSERHFYDDAACLKLQPSPASAVATQGQQIPVSVTVTPASGAAPVDQTVNASSSDATVTPTSAQTAESSPAQFELTMGAAATETVAFEGLSKRGRSEASAQLSAIPIATVLSGSSSEDDTATGSGAGGTSDSSDTFLGPDTTDALPPDCEDDVCAISLAAQVQSTGSSSMHSGSNCSQSYPPETDSYGTPVGTLYLHFSADGTLASADFAGGPYENIGAFDLASSGDDCIYAQGGALIAGLDVAVPLAPLKAGQPVSVAIGGSGSGPAVESIPTPFNMSVSFNEQITFKLNAPFEDNASTAKRQRRTQANTP